MLRRYSKFWRTKNRLTCERFWRLPVALARALRIVMLFATGGKRS